MFNENLDAFLEDFGVIAVVNGGNSSFFVLFDEFHSRMDIGVEGRSLIATAKSEDIANLILWYVYDRFDADGKILGIDVTFPGKEPKRFILKTPTDLWNLVEKINKSNIKEK